MRHMYRATFLALLAVLALSAVGSASAEAKECTKTSREKWMQFCVQYKGGEEIREITGEVPYATTSNTPATLKYIGGIKYERGPITVECATVKESGTFNANQTLTIPVSHRVVELSKCQLVKEPECQVTEPIVLGKESGASGMEGAISASGGEYKLMSSPEKTVPWGSLKIRTKLGEPRCWSEINTTLNSETETNEKAGLPCILPELSTEVVEHQVNCSSSKLQLGLYGEPVELAIDQKIAPTGTYAGLKWGIREKIA